MIKVAITITVVVILAVTTALVIDDRRSIGSLESFQLDTNIVRRTCRVRTADGGDFEFTDPDLPAIRSTPGGSDGQCYFLSSPADADDPECTKPHKWGLTSSSTTTRLRKGYVNGDTRCYLDVRNGEGRNTYAALQREIRDAYVGRANADVSVAIREQEIESDRLAKLERDGAGVYSRACHNATSVAPATWTPQNRADVVAALEAGTDVTLPESLTADATFLRDAALRLCNGERERCRILRPTYFDSPSSVAGRRDARWIASVLADAYPAADETTEELRNIADRLCASNKGVTDRCRVLRPEYDPNTHWSAWSSEQRRAATDLVQSLIGLKATHLSDAELSDILKLLCSGDANRKQPVAPGDTVNTCSLIDTAVGHSGERTLQQISATQSRFWSGEDRARALKAIRLLDGRQFGNVHDNGIISNALRKIC